MHTRWGTAQVQTKGPESNKKRTFEKNEIWVSTIIPTIGRPELHRAIESVLEQDLPACRRELIIVNDTGDPSVTERWNSCSGVTVVTTNHCERCHARNVGACIAKGKYLHFLDDDDYLLPGALKILADEALRSGCQWVTGAYVVTDREDNFMRTICPGEVGDFFAKSICGEAFPMGSVLFDRETFFSVGGFDPKYIVAEDRELERRFAFAAPVSYVPKVVFSARAGMDRGTTTRWQLVGEIDKECRTKALNIPGAFSRLVRTTSNRPKLRARVVKAYAGAALHAARSGSVGSFLRFGTLLLALLTVTLVQPMNIPTLVRYSITSAARWLTHNGRRLGSDGTLETGLSTRGCEKPHDS